MTIEVDGKASLEVFGGSDCYDCFKETFMFDFSCNSRCAEGGSAAVPNFPYIPCISPQPLTQYVTPPSFRSLH